MHLLGSRGTFWHGMPHLLLLFLSRVDRSVLGRCNAGNSRVVGHHLALVIIHGIPRLADEAWARPLLKAQHDTGVDANDANELHNALGCGQVRRGVVQFDVVDDLDDDQDKVDDEEEEGSDGNSWDSSLVIMLVRVCCV